MNLLDRVLSSPRHLAFWLLLAGVVLTAWVYAPALDSKLYLDSTKLYQLEQVYKDKGSDIRSQDIGFGSEYGRIVSQASFYLNITAADGLDTRAIKLTNVVIHGINALLVFVLAAMVFDRSGLADKRYQLAAFVAFAWLLSAVNVSSVAYAVQRMNQLSTLFSLLALVVYLHERIRSVREGVSPGRAAVSSAAIVVLTLLAYASKENGILVVVFIAVFEIFLFQETWTRLVKPGHRVGLGIMALVASVGGVLWIANTYWSNPAALPFTLEERLLTQTRILWVYIGQLLVPSSLATGLYQDGFPVSEGLFTPLSTMLAVAGVAGLVAIAFGFRSSDRLKPVGFGIAFFLGGHVLESTILPLELYYEHRNYLPSFGLYLALVTGGYLLLGRLKPAFAATAVVAYFAFFVVMAHAKAVTWSEERFVYDAALARSYISPRAAGEKAQMLLESGDQSGALNLLERVASDVPNQALRARLQILFIHCIAGIAPDDGLYAALPQATGRELGIEVSQALQNLLGAYERSRCPAVAPERLIPILQTVSGDRRRANLPSWHIDYYVASFYLLDDAGRAASWLEARFLEGEKSAGWMLLNLMETVDGVTVAPDTRRALEALSE